jgi:NDP-sugar pyrophosphorylase family protein
MEFSVIAAGEGSRLAQEGARRPKPLVLLNGAPLINRLIGIFLDNGATAVHIIINEEMKEVYEHLQTIRLPIPFHLTVKSTPGSLHSFFALSPYIRGERFCLTTVDTVFKAEEFGRYIRTFQADNYFDGLMAVTGYIDDEKPLYVNTDENLTIRSFTDKAQAESRYISGGIYCLKRRALNVLENAVARNKLRMRDYQRQLLAEGLTLKAYPFSKIVDIDHLEDIRKAEMFLNDSIYD